MTNPTDIPSLQLEVLKKIQAELSGLRAEVAEVKEGLGDLKSEVHEGFTRVRTELVCLRDEMEVGFTAMRMQNDRRFLDHERRLRELEQNVGK